MELTPGTAAGAQGMLRDGGQLPAGQVAETVELDEVLRTFDPETRRRFSVWLDQQGQAVQGQAQEINTSLALLTPFAEETDDVLRVLRVQGDATRRLVRDTGVVFEALTERKGQFRELISNSNRVWEAVASRDAELADTFRVFPTFLRESRITTERTTRFALEADPLVDQLRPAARELSPILIDLDRLAPDLRGLLPGPRPAGARVATRTAGDRTGARQHAPAPCSPRPLPAPAHARGRLPRALPARDRRVPCQRLRRHADRGHRASRRMTRSICCA